MGKACVLFNLINHLKQPYKCIVNYGCYSLQTGVIFLSCGIALLYFFLCEFERGNKLQRGLSVTGIVSVSVGLVLLMVGITIFVFYFKLYKLHEHHLEEIAEQEYCRKHCTNYVDKSDTNDDPALPVDKNLLAIKSDVSVTTALDAQQNLYPYNPNVTVAPSAPPPTAAEVIETAAPPLLVPSWVVIPPPGDPTAVPVPVPS